MGRDAYPTDLTNAEWAVVAPLIPSPKSGGRPRDVDLREILNAAVYRHRGGCSWRLLPHEFPPWQTVYTYVRAWQQDGTWARMLAALGEPAERHGSNAAAPRDGSGHLAPATPPGSADAVTVELSTMLPR